jgi:hypothetical protein
MTTPEDVVGVFVSGIVLVVILFVTASILAPSIASIMDLFVTQAIAGLVYLMVTFAILATLYQAFVDI